MILRIARVSSSNPDNTDTGLIGYLIRKGHWSPFEHASMTVEVRTSRAIAQQIIRHRSLVFQEFSQRYSEATDVIIYAGRSQAEQNRQSSTDDLDAETQDWWVRAQAELFDLSFRLYRTALEKGIAKECARFVLPLATETRIFITGNVRSWIHYLGDGPGGRTNTDTQQEHKEVALAIRLIFVELFPVVSQALGWTELVGE